MVPYQVAFRHNLQLSYRPARFLVTMRSFYRLALLALPLVGKVACNEKEKASPTLNPKPIYANAHEAFQDLLNALPEESLHAALNSISRFQEGVFESDRHGVERVHNENPPLATKLIVAAVQDLKKRQTPSNGTVPGTPSPSPQPSSEAPPPPAESSQAPPAEVPVEVTQTDANGQTAVISSVFFSEPTASVPVEVTQTDGQVATLTKPAVIFTETDAAGATLVRTSAVELAPTPGQVITTTDAKGSTFVTTYTPGGGKVSSIKLITTTGADGQPTVVTSYTFVEPGAAATGTDGQPLPSGTQGGRPGLQSGAAHKNRAMEAAMVGGAVGGAFALWI